MMRSIANVVYNTYLSYRFNYKIYSESFVTSSYSVNDNAMSKTVITIAI